jgi:hypothetical protein
MRGKMLERQRLDDGSLLLRAVAMVPESQLSTLEDPHRSRVYERASLGGADGTPGVGRRLPVERERGSALAGRVPEVAASSSTSNSPELQEVFFRLELSELKQVVGSLRRLRELGWNMVYRRTGFTWEAIRHIPTVNRVTAYSLRLSEKIRAIAFRDGDFLWIISLHPGHDSAYGR